LSRVTCYLRRIFGPTGEEVTGGCRTLYNEECHTLYSPPDITSLIKGRMRHVRHIRQMRNMNLNGRHHLKELGRDGRITLKWNLKE
jgi:hypothetical protein